MNDEELFRKKLGDLLDGNQYTYDAGNWDKASQVLDQNDSRRRKRVLFILFFIGLGLAVGGYLFFVPGKPAAQTLALRTDEHKPAAEKPVDLNSAGETHPASQNPSALEKTPAAKTQQKPAGPVPVKEPQPVREKRDPESPTQAAHPVKPGKTPAQNTSTAYQPVTPGKINVQVTPGKNPSTKDAGASSDKKDEQDKNTKPDQPDMQLPVVQNPGTVPPKEESRDAETDPGKKGIEDAPVPATAVANGTKDETAPATRNAPEKENAPAKDIVPEKKKIEEAPSTPAIAAAQKEDTPRTETAPEKKAAEEAPAPETSSVAAAEKDSVPKNLALKDSVLLKKPDSTAVAMAQPTLAPQPALNYCFAEAGGFFNLGWKYTGEREGTGINPYLGLSYMMELSDKTKISAGIYYTTVSGLKLGSKTITSSHIVFGEEKEVTTITPQRLNYVSVPLKLYYAIDRKQSFSFGCSVNYLLDVQSKVVSYTEKLNTVHDQKTYRTGGYVEGFKTFNTQIGLGYRRSLYKNLSINADLLFGLGDLRDDVFSGIPLHERMTGLRLSLTYDLIKK